MIVTENEAAEKLCPMTRGIRSQTTCIGKSCMAFRQYGWKNQNGAYQQKYIGQTEPSPPPSEYHQYEEVFYCGIAGKP